MNNVLNCIQKIFLRSDLYEDSIRIAAKNGASRAYVSYLEELEIMKLRIKLNIPASI